ncbi:uncharacterized protein LOC141903976 isoform X1 [Tubulanus polymorphus]|uniref:uncharacterized protein LOC141903976 isoform X1 n=1 Tax=Tubulanus polymorphus TaxID=672921 RepID=UPI003DA23AB7
MGLIAYPTLIIAVCSAENAEIAFVGFDFIFGFLGTANTFTLTVAAFHRYMMVSRNQQHGKIQRRTHYTGYLVGIKIASIVITAISTVIPYSIGFRGTASVILNTSRMFITLLIPILVMSVCYRRIYRQMKQVATQVRLNRISTVSWRYFGSAADVISPSIHRSDDKSSSMQKTVGYRMLLIIHLTLISWLPDSLFTIISASCDFKIRTEYRVLVATLAFTCLLYNPILNVAVHSYLKKSFKMMLLCQGNLVRISPNSTSFVEMKRREGLQTNASAVVEPILIYPPKSRQMNKPACKTVSSLSTLRSAGTEDGCLPGSVGDKNTGHVTINDGILLHAPDLLLRSRQPSLSPSMISTISSVRISSFISDDAADTDRKS